MPAPASAAALPPAGPLAEAGVPPRGALTEVDVRTIKGRLDQRIRFGRVAVLTRIDEGRAIAAFRPGAVFALSRWTADDVGREHHRIAILAAVAAGAPCERVDHVRPGAAVLLAATGDEALRALAAIDAVDAGGIDPCDVDPAHWRGVGAAIATDRPLRPYGAARHAAWLRRQGLGR